MPDPGATSGRKTKPAIFFGFGELPFGVTPDPRFFYPSTTHAEGLATLGYGIEAKKGLMLLTGEVGSGKTTLLRALMGRLCDTAEFGLLSAMGLGARDLLELISNELGLDPIERTRVEWIEGLKEHLLRALEKGRAVALLVDEAQALGDEALESLCELLNLETDREKLLQIVLAGQPDCAARLLDARFQRLKQRVALHYRLRALSGPDEVQDYVMHRLRVAGSNDLDLFDSAALEAVYYYSGGVPRVINMVCDNALALACSRSRRKPAAELVIEAASALLLDGTAEGWARSSNGSTFAASEGGAFVSGRHLSRCGSERGTGSDPGVENDANGPVPGFSTEPDAGSEAEWVSRRTTPEPVSREFFYELGRAAVEALGPMGDVVVRDQIASLGESADRFPRGKLGKLIDGVAREILHPTMREQFEEQMMECLAGLTAL